MLSDTVFHNQGDKLPGSWMARGLQLGTTKAQLVNNS